MYGWYKNAEICLVYLDDAGEPKCRWDTLSISKAFAAAKWRTRGWTLQELIAPHAMIFYDRNWMLMGYKEDLTLLISQSTGIPESVLTSGGISGFSIAQKMSWAAGRITTREEDRAYSLLGLFDVHMPMMYGEGRNAFRRLQEELIRTSEDDSIFAWPGRGTLLSSCSGLLADSPDAFHMSGDVLRGGAEFNSTKNGVQLQTFVKSLPKTHPYYQQDYQLELCKLNARLDRPNDNQIALLMRRSNAGVTRTNTVELSKWGTSVGEEQTVTVANSPEILPGFRSRQMLCFDLRSAQHYSRLEAIRYEVFETQPRHIDTRSRHLVIQRNTGSRDFIQIVWLHAYDGGLQRSVSLQLLLAYNPLTAHVWCKILTAEENATQWLQSAYAHKNLRSSDQLRLSGAIIARVVVAPGLHDGHLSHIVSLNGLIVWPTGGSQLNWQDMKRMGLD